ncbi:MAG TPA: hypothetical protein VEF76_05305 [Patescibacteria group bacterium]|nr:hypothetical protein [Patescibacteria group bacterium]
MDWKTASSDEKLQLVRDINRVEPVYKFSPEDSIVETLPLSFYHGGQLVSIVKPMPLQPQLWYVKLPSEIVNLDGSVANIHHLNERAPLALSPQVIADYLKFRLYFAGSMWLEGVLAIEAAEGFQATARVLEQEGLFEKKFAVSPRGELTLQAKKKLGAGKRPPARFSF